MEVSMLNTIVFLISLLVTAQGNYLEEDGVIVLRGRIFEKALGEFPFLLVEFYAPWCGHCKSLAPEYSKAALLLKEYNIILAKIDATEEKVLAARYQVNGFPKILFFKGGLKMDYNGPRDWFGIVEWVNQHSIPFFSVIEYQLDLSNFLEQNDQTLAYFQKQGELVIKKQQQILADLSQAFQNVRFILISQPKLRETYNLREDNCIIFFIKGNQTIYIGDPQIYEGIKEFIGQQIFPLVCSFDEFLSKEGKQLPGLIFWEDSQTYNFRQEFTDLANQFKDKIQFVMIQEQQLIQEKQFLAFMRVSGVQNGAIFIIDNQIKLKYKMEDPINFQNTQNFIAKFLGQSLEPMKNLPRQNNQGGVIELTSEEFQDVVIDSPQDVLVEFYAPWCGHCKKLEPIYEELANQLKHNKDIIISKIDMTKYKIQDIEVKGFPTIKFFKKGSSYQILDYNGERSLDDFKKFLKDHTSHNGFEREEL